MSFTRVKPAGYAFGEKLTSTEMNQLDIDHENSLDKTGDTTTGDIEIGAGFKLEVSGVAAVIDLSGTGKLELSGTATIEQTGVGSEIKLYKPPTYLPVPTVKLWMPLLPRVLPAGWSMGDTGSMNADANGDNVQFSLQHIPDGATLDYGVFQVAMSGPHGGVPGLQPRVEIRRYDPVNNLSVVIGTATMAAGSVGAYEATTQVTADCTASAYRTIDKGQYEYYAAIRAESGANAMAGSVWRGVQIWFGLPTLGGY